MSIAPATNAANTTSDLQIAKAMSGISLGLATISLLFAGLVHARPFDNLYGYAFVLMAVIAISDLARNEFASSRRATAADVEQYLNHSVKLVVVNMVLLVVGLVVGLATYLPTLT